MPVIPKKRKLLQILNHCKPNIYTIFRLSEYKWIVLKYYPSAPFFTIYGTPRLKIKNLFHDARHLHRTDRKTGFGVGVHAASVAVGFS